ncbi:MAG: tol-pal system YbgF family protein [Phycisphaerae bacterium]
MLRKLAAILCLLIACAPAAAQAGRPAGGRPAPVATPKPGPVGNQVVGVVMPDGNGGYKVVPGGSTVGTGAGLGTIDNSTSEVDLMRNLCRKAAERCQAAIAKGDWVAAKDALDQALRNCVDQAVAEALGPLATQIEKEGRNELAAATQLYDQAKYVEALKEYGRISRTFIGLPVGTAALEALKAAEADPNAKAGVQEAKALPINGVVERILDGASSGTSRPASQPSSAPAGPSPNRPARIKALAADKQLEVVDTLTRIATLFPLSPTGMQAAADLEELKADKAFQDSITRQRTAAAAKAALNKAQLYRDSGMTAKAVEAYKEVIANFPDTPEAKQAQAALANLGGGAK